MNTLEGKDRDDITLIKLMRGINKQTVDTLESNGKHKQAFMTLLVKVRST